MSDTIEIHIDKADGSNMVGRLRYIGRRHAGVQYLNMQMNGSAIQAPLRLIPKICRCAREHFTLPQTSLLFPEPFATRHPTGGAANSSDAHSVKPEKSKPLRRLITCSGSRTIRASAHCASDVRGKSFSIIMLRVFACLP